jgi:protocatechuate 3,4-dioxygenase beta subunit
MENDDVPVGKLLTRREVFMLFGGVGAAFLASGSVRPYGASAAVPSCVVRPQQTEGPYFVDGPLDRSDIRTEPDGGGMVPGAPLELTLIVSRLSRAGCEPLPDARVDVWQCDARGVYSGVRDPRFDTVGQHFLRGSQVTSEGGEARFQTIYPGWYRGRTVHIHFKIRTDPTARRGYEFTSQLYFDDELTDHIHAAAPYGGPAPRRTRNRQDGIFRRGGEQLMLAPAETSRGLAASFAIGLEI